MREIVDRDEKTKEKFGIEIKRLSILEIRGKFIKLN